MLPVQHFVQKEKNRELERREMGKEAAKNKNKHVCVAHFISSYHQHMHTLTRHTDTHIHTLAHRDTRQHTRDTHTHAYTHTCTRAHTLTHTQEDRQTQDWIRERQKQREDAKRAREEVKAKLEQDKLERQARASGRTGLIRVSTTR